MSADGPIRVEELPGDSLSPDDAFVVKIVRPHGDPPAYWIEDRDGEVMLCFPMSDHLELAEHLPNDATSYHRIRFNADPARNQAICSAVKVYAPAKLSRDRSPWVRVTGCLPPYLSLLPLDLYYWPLGRG